MIRRFDTVVEFEFTSSQFADLTMSSGLHFGKFYSTFVDAYCRHGDSRVREKGLSTTVYMRSLKQLEKNEEILILISPTQLYSLFVQF